MSQSYYQWVLFDLDETLFDFPARQALLATLSHFDLAPDPALIEAYQATNHALWAQFNAGQIDADTLQRQRFAGIGQVSGRCPREINHLFLDQIIAMSQPLEGVIETLQRLRGRIGMGIITNGFSRPQRGRLQRHALHEWFSPLLISDEVGVAKPDAAIFEQALAALPVTDPARVLMVGDNPGTDIAGAAAAGLSTCWYDPQHKDLPCQPTHRIHHFSELASLLFS